MKKNVLGVRIDDVSEKEAIEFVKRRLLYKKSSSQDYGKLIFTPGPEFLVTAKKDQEFKEILNSSDLNVPDGFGLHFAGVHERVAGVDLMVALCKLAEEKKCSVGLLGGFGGVAGSAGEKLLEKFPNLKVSFAISNAKADQIVSHYLIDSSIALSSDILKCDVLFVGLGHPKQEKFLFSLVNSKFEMASRSSGTRNFKFRVGMGVGGSFDLIAGSKIRAPKFVSSLGFEWLWRALQDPRHFVRVWRATGEFLWLLMTSNFLRRN